MSAVPTGTLCLDGGLVHTTDERCSADASASPSPDVATTFVPSASPGTSITPVEPVSCRHLVDGYYCISSSEEALMRGDNSSLYACTDSFYRCSAGRTFPAQHVALGTACLDGNIVYATDERCAAPTPIPVATATAAPEEYCDPGLHCNEQCGRYYYACVNGRKQQVMRTSLGTVCYDWGSGAFLIHENDLRCLVAQQWCDAHETSMRCYSAENKTCADHFYLCGDGQPYFIQPMSEGTACYNGQIIHSNDAICEADRIVNTTDPLPSTMNGSEAWVQVQAIAKGLSRDALLSPTQSAQLRVLLASLCNCGTNFNAIYIYGVTDTSIDDVLPFSGVAQRRRRLGQAAPVQPVQAFQSRVMTTYDELPTSIWQPRTQPLADIPVVSEDEVVGDLGVGAAMFNITIACTANQSAAIAQSIALIMGMDATSGISPLSAAMAAAGSHGVVSALSISTTILSGASSTSPTSSQASQESTLGPIIGGSVAAIAFVGLVAVAWMVATGRLSLRKTPNQSQLQRVNEGSADPNNADPVNVEDAQIGWDVDFGQFTREGASTGTGNLDPTQIVSPSGAQAPTLPSDPNAGALPPPINGRKTSNMQENDIDTPIFDVNSQRRASQVRSSSQNSLPLPQLRGPVGLTLCQPTDIALWDVDSAPFVSDTPQPGASRRRASQDSINSDRTGDIKPADGSSQSQGINASPFLSATPARLSMSKRTTPLPMWSPTRDVQQAVLVRVPSSEDGGSGSRGSQTPAFKPGSGLPPLMPRRGSVTGVLPVPSAAMDALREPSFVEPTPLHLDGPATKTTINLATAGFGRQHDVTHLADTTDVEATIDIDEREATPTANQYVDLGIMVQNRSKNGSVRKPRAQIPVLPKYSPGDPDDFAAL
jgi:hypothetical protein